MASQTEVLKALHEKEGPTKTLDLAKEAKTSDDTLIPARHGIQRSRASLRFVAAAMSLSTCSGSRYPFKSRTGVTCVM